MGAGRPDKDYYSILEAQEDASASDIERSYKRLAQQHHPDRGGDEEEMKSLNEAYGVLRDGEKRRAYDEERRRPGETQEAWQPSASPSAHVDAATGQSLSAVLFLAAGVALAFLVRFQWMWFLWPLAILALFLVIAGVLMAHAAMQRVGSELSASHPWFGVGLEVAFWAVVFGGGYGIYLVLS
jgi:hypothetical protein